MAPPVAENPPTAPRVTRPNLVLCAGRASGVEAIRDRLALSGRIAWAEARDFAHVDGDEATFPLNTFDPAFTGDPGAGDAFEAIARRHAGRAAHIGWQPGFVIEFPHVIGQIALHLPRARLLFCLRDPVAAAHHRFKAQPACMPVSFEEAIDACLERMRDFSRFARRSDWSRLLADPDPEALLLQGGVYAPAVARCLRLFPREQVHVVTWEGFRDRPVEHVAGIFRFLGIESPPPPTKPEPVAVACEDAIDAATHERLRRFYDPFNRALRDLLSWDATPWG